MRAGGGLGQTVAVPQLATLARLARRLRVPIARGVLVADRDAWRLPPAATLFVQRKLGGLYLMAARLGARVDLRALLARSL